MTLLALGKALAMYAGIDISTDTIAKIAGRGGTSGASVNLFDRGGYLVDGGHENPADFIANPENTGPQ